MKSYYKTISVLLLSCSMLFGQRIKDVAYLTGENNELLIGYGLVVGLAGTGDSYRMVATMQSLSSALKRFGITVSQDDIKSRNVAAVFVTAKLNNQLKQGASFDVTVASNGDAASLLGGTLLYTRLSNPNDQLDYATAQGPISVGGYDFSTPTGNRLSKNPTTTGRVPMGGSLIAPLRLPQNIGSQISIFLKNPDFTTANNVATAINAKFNNAAKAADATEIQVVIPQEKQANMVGFISELESITVQTDVIAKVVLNERTGTVVAGSNVIILPATITHGSLNLTIRSYPVISQPNAFSQGKTEVFNNLIPYIQQDSTKSIAIQRATTVSEVAAALNSLKVTPRDIISIFQALKEAGALVAELIII